MPGCRSARGLEIHHIVRRADGGSHPADNLVLLCSACHIAHHDGRLVISGTASELVVKRARAHVGASNAEDDAVSALSNLGWKPAIARRAVERALDVLGVTAGLEVTIREALKHCAS